MLTILRVCFCDPLHFILYRRRAAQAPKKIEITYHLAIEGDALGPGMGGRTTRLWGR